MSKPAVFFDLDYPSALQAARAEGKWLVVDATAAWCGPCKAMDRTSWIDPVVAAWIAQHAIAIQVDVDAEPATAKQLEIRAMPTVIAFREGIEFDRSVGLKQPNELLSWLDGLLRGETALARLRVEAAQQPTGMMGRMSLARALANGGKVDEATDEYAWLWQHMLEHEPAMLGVRASFMLAEIADLAGRHGPARTRFSALRDAAAPTHESLDADRLGDWMLLNQALGEPQRTLDWFDRERQRLASDAKLSPLLETTLIPLLIEGERWADAGALYADPVNSVKQHHQIITQVTGLRPSGMDDATFDEVRRQVVEQFQKTARQVHRCLIAAGRRDDAGKVESVVRVLDPTVSFE